MICTLNVVIDTIVSKHFDYILESADKNHLICWIFNVEASPMCIIIYSCMQRKETKNQLNLMQDVVANLKLKQIRVN